MAEPEHLKLLELGRQAFNEWWAKNKTTRLELENADLRGRDLSGYCLRGAALHRANLEGANLYETDLQGANLVEARLSKANLDRADLGGAEAQQAVFDGASLKEAKLNRLRAKLGSFAKANLANAIVESAQLTAAKLGGASLDGARIVDTILKDAECSRVSAKGARLSHVDGPGSNWTDADLSMAAIRHSKLHNAVFFGARLAGADLRDSDFSEANLSRSDLRRVRLLGAKLTNSEVAGAAIRRYDLEDVRADNYCGLLPSQRESMEVEDGYERLRLFLGGFQAWLHVTGFVLWVTPQLALLVRAVALAIAEGMLGDRVVRLPIFLQIWGYIRSGLFSPMLADDGEPEYPLSWPFLLTWCALFIYNFVRMLLVYYVKKLEHRHAVKGLHPLVDIGPYGRAGLVSLQAMVYVSLALGALQFLNFLLTPYPTLVAASTAE